MATSGSASSNCSASSSGCPQPYTHVYTSPNGSSSRAPSSSAASAVTSSSSAPPPTPLRPLDLGPPGYQATITLFERTANETTVYLGPWELINSEPRRVRWQCSYQGEVLEQFLPSSQPVDIFPHTLHGRHRPYGDPCDMELFLTFLEPHRIRYVTSDNILVHDDHVEVKYEFTTMEGSLHFQGDLRSQDLVDHFDIDVVWSDRDSRTDSFGSVRGIGAIQRMKLWRDRYNAYHSITMYANRTDRRYHDYHVSAFDSEIKNRDDSHRRLRLTVRGRRGSAPDSGSSDNKGGGHSSRRFSMSSLRQRPRASTSGHHHSSHASSSRSSRSSQSQSHPEQASAGSPPSSASSFSPGDTLAIRYLGIQFSRNEDYFRFMEQWAHAQSADAEFSGVPFPVDCFELPSPELHPGDRVELTDPLSSVGLPVVEEPQYGTDDGGDDGGVLYGG